MIDKKTNQREVMGILDSANKLENLLSLDYKGLYNEVKKTGEAYRCGVSISYNAENRLYYVSFMEETDTFPTPSIACKRVVELAKVGKEYYEIGKDQIERSFKETKTIDFFKNGEFANICINSPNDKLEESLVGFWVKTGYELTMAYGYKLLTIH